MLECEKVQTSKLMKRGGHMSTRYSDKGYNNWRVDYEADSAAHEDLVRCV